MFLGHKHVSNSRLLFQFNIFIIITRQSKGKPENSKIKCKGWNVGEIVVAFIHARFSKIFSAGMKYQYFTIFSDRWFLDHHVIVLQPLFPVVPTSNP